MSQFRIFQPAFRKFNVQKLQLKVKFFLHPDLTICWYENKQTNIRRKQQLTCRRARAPGLETKEPGLLDQDHLLDSKCWWNTAMWLSFHTQPAPDLWRSVGVHLFTPMILMSLSLIFLVCVVVSKDILHKMDLL